MSTALNCILLIDDHEPINFIHKRVISKAEIDAKVSVARNGQEALDYLEANVDTDAYPDLIFIDINMPVMNGWEFLENYLEIYHHRHESTVVAILSTSENPDDIQRASDYDVLHGYMSKPLEVDTIKQFVQENFCS